MNYFVVIAIGWQSNCLRAPAVFASAYESEADDPHAEERERDRLRNRAGARDIGHPDGVDQYPVGVEGAQRENVRVIRVDIEGGIKKPRVGGRGRVQELKRLGILRRS